MHLILYIAGCVLLIAFFTGMEMAFATANRINIELKKKQDIFSGRVLGMFMEKPSAFIGASLVGVSVLLALYVSLISAFNVFWIKKLPLVLQSPYVKLLIDIITGAILILIFGELLPRVLFKKKSSSVLSFFSFPMLVVYRIFHPISKLFVSLSAFILKYLFNVRIKDKEVFTRVDVDHFVKYTLHGSEMENNKDVDIDLFDKALDLVNVKVRNCMIPRNEVIGIDMNSSIEMARQKFIDTQLSKIVVYETNLDHIAGYLHHLDLNKKPRTLKDIMHTIAVVPEAMSAVNLINRFTKERKSIAWVIDEFGGTAGIVTMEDVLEEIFGDIRDEYDDDEYVEKQIAEDEYIFSGRLEIDYLNEKYGFNLQAENAETLSGYIVESQERIPKTKARIIIGLYEFDILLVSDTRIETVKMKVLKPL